MPGPIARLGRPEDPGAVEKEGDATSADDDAIVGTGAEWRCALPEGLAASQVGWSWRQEPSLSYGAMPQE